MLQFLLHQLFRFFSSLKLAVILLVLLAAALAVGTMQESLHDGGVARDAVYHTWWFVLLLTLLAMNVAGAALSRYPWKKRHIGFVTTHAGIILILAGSLVTVALGKNGQMTLPIGHSSHTVLLTRQFLSLQIPEKGIEAFFFINPRKNKRQDLPLAAWSPVAARVTQVIPRAKVVTKIREEGRGSPGVLVRLAGMAGEINEWLILGDPVRERLRVGPAELIFLSAASQEELDFLLNETDPAKGKDKKFKFPESDRNALWLIMGPQGKLYYRLKVRGAFAQQGPLYKSNEYRTGWMDFKFSLEDYRDNVVMEREYETVPPAEANDTNSTAIQVKLIRKAAETSVWLELDETKTVDIEGVKVQLSYLWERMALPFVIKLLKFNLGRYEGTSNPMSYESFVEVRDLRKENSFTRKINMNHPMKYGGLSFYQAAFHQEGGEPVASVLSVGKDPGIPLKYLGSLILVIGIGIQFFAKKWLTRESSKETVSRSVEIPQVRVSREPEETVVMGRRPND